MDILTDRFVTVDGLNIRYLEAGDGHPALLLHGASLGSSADVFRRNLAPLAIGGLRAIAFDYPGYGLSDQPANWSVAYRREMIPKFIDALGLGPAALIPHSQSGGMAVQLVLKEPDRYTHLLAIGAGGILPPQNLVIDGNVKKNIAKPADEDESEPDLAVTRRQLEAITFHPDLVTDEEVARRHRLSIGKNFDAEFARTQAKTSSAGGGGKNKPVWQRLIDITIPFTLMIGRQDRAQSLERAELLMQEYPQLDIRLIDDCKHMISWDAAEEVERVAISMIADGAYA